ncbi:MAG: DMT family transporter [Prevotella sp.]|nr:DMT family transporter [Prevotella sp.]
MWLAFAFLSAFLLGLYDVCKKSALKDNAVVPVLFLNTLFSTAIFLPFILTSAEPVTWAVHRYILVKSCIVLSSWLFGYFAMKHLPLTIVGPVNATRPVMVLVGAMLLFGERLNLYQWIGVSLAVFSFFLLSRSGRKEGIDFGHNRWIWFLILAALLGAASGLYDKFLMASASEGGVGLRPIVVQSWFNLYQCLMMGVVLVLLWWPVRRQTTPFRWSWSIPLISLFLAAADASYFYSLSMSGAMISIVSMVRRGSVIVSFLAGALLFGEKNLRSKAVDLLLVLLAMLFLWVGTH